MSEQERAYERQRQTAYYYAHEDEMKGVTLEDFLRDCQGPKAVDSIMEVGE
jgi:hypothetical protein